MSRQPPTTHSPEPRAQSRTLRAALAGGAGFVLLFGAAQLLRAGLEEPLRTLLVLLVVAPAAAVGGALPARVLGYDWPLAVAASVSAHATALLTGFAAARFVSLEVAYALILCEAAIVTMLILVTDRIFIARDAALAFSAMSFVLLWLVLTIPVHHVPGGLLGLLTWVSAPACASLALERE